MIPHPFPLPLRDAAGSCWKMASSARPLTGRGEGSFVRATLVGECVLLTLIHGDVDDERMAFFTAIYQRAFSHLGGR